MAARLRELSGRPLAELLFQSGLLARSVDVVFVGTGPVVVQAASGHSQGADRGGSGYGRAGVGPLGGTGIALGLVAALVAVAGGHKGCVGGAGEGGSSCSAQGGQQPVCILSMTRPF